MMLTDEELFARISNRYDNSALRVDLEQVEQRGRQRRRNGRIATGAMMAVAALAIGGTVAFAMHRNEVNHQTAAFDQACQTVYTQEAGKTLHASQLPARLDKPIIELRSGGAAFRLYAAAPNSLRSLIFDCSRTADGAISGRISFGAKDVPTFAIPALVYRDTLPDGTAALVAQLANPHDTVTVSPRTSAQVAVKNGYVVVWGSPAEIDKTVLSFAGGGRIDVASDVLALTATYQEPEFETQCLHGLQERHMPASLVLTAQHGANDVLKVYRSGNAFAVCQWSILADDPANGLSYNGPMTALASSTPLGGAEYATTLRVIQSDGSGAWISGITPPGTRHVEIHTTGGTTVPAELGDGAYAAWVPGLGDYTTITMTTDTHVYTVTGKQVTRIPR